MHEQDEIFPSRPSGAQGDFALHGGGISTEEIEVVKIFMKDRIIQITGMGVVNGRLSFVKAIQGDVTANEIQVIQDPRIGLDGRSFSVHSVLIFPSYHELVSEVR